MKKETALCLTVTVSLIFLLISCATPPPLPEAVDTQPERDGERVVTIDALNHGRTLYINKCGGCHMLIQPLSYTDSEWSHWVGKMQVKAHLNGDDEETILLYLMRVNHKK